MYPATISAIISLSFPATGTADMFQALSGCTSALCNGRSSFFKQSSYRVFATGVGRWKLVSGVSTFLKSPFVLPISLCAWPLFIADITMVLTGPLGNRKQHR